MLFAIWHEYTSNMLKNIKNSKTLTEEELASLNTWIIKENDHLVNKIVPSDELVTCVFNDDIRVICSNLKNEFSLHLSTYVWHIAGPCYSLTTSAVKFPTFPHFGRRWWLYFCIDIFSHFSDYFFNYAVYGVVQK